MDDCVAHLLSAIIAIRSSCTEYAMGNVCCEGRSGKLPVERKQTLLGPLRTANLSRSASSISKRPKHIVRKVTAPLLGSSPQTAPADTPTTLPDAPFLPPVIEDSRDEGLSLDYSLEQGSDCSQVQQKLLLSVLGQDEALDGLTSLSVLGGSAAGELLVLALTSKRVLLLSAFNYAEVRWEMLLGELKLLCVSTDRTLVALVYRREGKELEHTVLSSCAHLEDLLKALVAVCYDACGHCLPSISLPTLEAILAYLRHLSWTGLNDLTSPASEKVFRLFATQGMIGEIQQVQVQAVRKTDSGEDSVELVVSDKAMYVKVVGSEQVERLPLERLVVRSLDSGRLSVVTDTEQVFTLPSRQSQMMEQTIAACRHRPRHMSL